MFNLKKKRLIAPLAYHSIKRCDYNPTLFIVELNKKYGIIDKNGKIAIPIKYDEIHGRSYHLFVAKENGQTSIIDEKGKVVP